MKYAIFILLIYLAIVLVAIWLYDSIEEYGNRKKPIKLPFFTNKEKKKKTDD